MPQTTTSSVPAQKQGGMMSGLGSTMMTGMAFGAGSEIAHQAIRSVTGGGSHGHVENATQQELNQNHEETPKVQQNQCFSFNQKFVDCLKISGNDISDCQNLFNDLKSCEKGLI